MLISTCWLTRKISASEEGIARPATRSGRPAASSDAKTTMRMTAAIGSETVSARWRSCSEASAESLVSGPYPVSCDGRAGGRHDLLAQRLELVDGLLVAEVELDEHVRGVAVGADEAPVAGLREAHDAGDAVVTGEAPERRVDRRLELGRRRVGRGVAPEERDEAAAARAELAGEPLADRRRLGRVVEPAARASDRRTRATRAPATRRRAAWSPGAPSAGSDRRTCPTDRTSLDPFRAPHSVFGQDRE